MAIDPRISLAVQTPSAAQAINIFENALVNAQNRDIAAAQEARRAELAPLQQQAAQQRVDIGQQQIDTEAENRIIRSISEFSPVLKPLLESAITSGDTSQALSAIDSRIDQLQRSQRPVQESIDARNKIAQGDIQGVLNDLSAIDAAAGARGLRGAATSVGQREFENLVGIAKGDPEGKTIEGRAAGVRLGTIAKASTSAAERIATDPVLTSAVAASTAEIAGAKEAATKEAELTKQLKFKPQITRATKLAEKEATERGEVLTDLKRSEAALPGLLNAVGQLRELSTIATSTIGEKIFDAAVKQTGFGSTKGATARAKFIAIIDNQVLPLLKPTFGAAFTVQEGESLKATLGDPDASPAEKMAQLDAFIDQKRRDIETKQRQLGSETQPTGAVGGFNSTALGRQISEQDIADTLQANPGITREQLLQQLGVQ